MTGACDERSPCWGGEKEEPNEPPPPESCRLRVIGGARALPFLESRVKEPFYRYNTLISGTGYMVKPVHKVYKRTPSGVKVYVYLGRYWWRRRGRRMVYAGTRRPASVPVPPPRNPLEGTSIIVEGDDIIIPCHAYEYFEDILSGFSIVREG